MLREGAKATREAHARNVVFIEGDATHHSLPDERSDMVVVLL